MCVCLVCIALSKAPASSRPPGHNGLQLPPSPATRAAARASAREPFLARALIFVLVGPHEQTKHLWFPVTSRFRLETFQVFQVYEYSPLFFFFLPASCLPPHSIPISEAFDSVLLLNSSWNSSISKSSSSPPPSPPPPPSQAERRPSLGEGLPIRGWLLSAGGLRVSNSGQPWLQTGT